MIHESKFDIGQRVRLVHDPANEVRMVAQVSFGGTGVRYNQVCGASDTWHYEFEVTEADSAQPTVVKGFNPNA